MTRAKRSGLPLFVGVAGMGVEKNLRYSACMASTVSAAAYTKPRQALCLSARRVACIPLCDANLDRNQFYQLLIPSCHLKKVSPNNSLAFVDEAGILRVMQIEKLKGFVMANSVIVLMLSIGLFSGIDALKSIGYLIVRLLGQYLRHLELP